MKDNTFGRGKDLTLHAQRILEICPTARRNFRDPPTGKHKEARGHGPTLMEALSNADTGRERSDRGRRRLVERQESNARIMETRIRTTSHRGEVMIESSSYRRSFRLRLIDLRIEVAGEIASRRTPEVEVLMGTPRRRRQGHNLRA